MLTLKTIFLMAITKPSRFQSNPKLCPVVSLQAYLERTEPLRKEETSFFLSFIKPHGAVTSSTIARWLRLTLELAGIDSSIFGTHFTRGASASAAARGGIITEYILKAADWSSESVFQRFYHKSIDKSAYGKAVLSRNSLE
uniref:Tyr recombinase domain-containing protein n=1 Tax=Amphimedon queenslandica TaxID=400682 RepID=A0A1X7UE04_AMPQE